MFVEILPSFSHLVPWDNLVLVPTGQRLIDQNQKFIPISQWWFPLVIRASKCSPSRSFLQANTKKHAQTPFIREKLDRLLSDPGPVLAQKCLQFSRDLLHPYLFWLCLEPLLDLPRRRASSSLTLFRSRVNALIQIETDTDTTRH